MADKKAKKTMAETLYNVNVSPLPVMPSFDKDIIMKKIEDPPFEDEKESERSPNKKSSE